MVLRWLALGLMAGALSACSMAHSTWIDGSGDTSGDPVGRNARMQRGGVRDGRPPATSVRCQSDLGAYYLSRSLLKITLWQVGPKPGEVPAKKNNVVEYFSPRHEELAPPASGLYRLQVERETVADAGKGYCLDYLASATSNDVIGVKRTEDALLVEISSIAEDQSVQIAKKVIDIIFIGITGNTNYRSQLPGRANTAGQISDFTPVQVFTATYDPTVPMQAALVNERLKDFGHCLILGEHAPERKHDFARYCQNPVAYLRAHKLDRDTSLEEAPLKVARATNGIYYRPRRPFSYYVLRQENKKVADSWRLAETATVKLENSSPVLVAGIDRTVFAKRRSKLTFDQGALKSVSLDKTSELLAFTEIPLYLAESVVALPAAIIKVDIDTAVVETNLIGAELELMNARNAHRDKERDLRELLEKQAKGG